MTISIDRFSRLISSFKDRDVIVFGDYYLDRYIYSRVIAVSPEMPVLRVVEESVEHSPGAAGNVAANFASLGARVRAFGVIGNDAEGQNLVDCLNNLNVDTSNLLIDPDRYTGTFTRIITGSNEGILHHHIRIDKENTHNISKPIMSELFVRLRKIIKDTEAIYLADYDESKEQTGILSQQVIQDLTKIFHDSNKILAGSSRQKLRSLNGVDLVFCNLVEANALTSGNIEDYEAVGRDVLSKIACKTLCITLGAKGAYYLSDNINVKVPAYRDKITDPCGGGDSFSSAFVLSKLSGAEPKEAMEIASGAAAISVSKKGTAPVSASELLFELKFRGGGGGKLKSAEDLSESLKELRPKNRIVFTNGYFDLFHSGHVHLLRKAKEYGDILIVAINSDRSTKANKGEGRPVLSEIDRIHILSALEFVDFVTVFDELTPINCIREIRPDIIVKGGNYKEEEVIGKDIISPYGGEVHVIPYEGEIRTVDLIKTIKDASDGMR